jgi:hypothetical protein
MSDALEKNDDKTHKLFLRCIEQFDDSKQKALLKRYNEILQDIKQ